MEHDSRAPLIPLPEEKKTKQPKRKTQKSHLLPPHTATSYDLVVPIHSPRVQQLMRTQQLEDIREVVQRGKSDYSRELLPERATIPSGPTTSQENTDLQKNDTTQK